MLQDDRLAILIQLQMLLSDSAFKMNFYNGNVIFQFRKIMQDDRSGCKLYLKNISKLKFSILK